MIPKIIHYCWFGGNPLPDSAIKCIDSWRKFFPGWEIKEWNESNFDVNMIAYTREAYRLKKYAYVSDYARFWILYNYGGVYFDTDVEVIKPFDDIISKGAFMGYQDPKDASGKLMPNTGLGLGASAKMALLNTIIIWYQNHHFANWKGCPQATVVKIVSDILSPMPKTVQDNGIVSYGEDLSVYPPDYFCPLNYWTGKLIITERTRSIHQYSASWIKQRQESRLGHILDVLKWRFEYFFSLFYSKWIYKK